MYTLWRKLHNGSFIVQVICWVVKERKNISHCNWKWRNGLLREHTVQQPSYIFLYFKSNCTKKIIFKMSAWNMNAYRHTVYFWVSGMFLLRSDSFETAIFLSLKRIICIIYARLKAGTHGTIVYRPNITILGFSVFLHWDEKSVVVKNINFDTLFLSRLLKYCCHVNKWAKCKVYVSFAKFQGQPAVVSSR